MVERSGTQMKVQDIRRCEAIGHVHLLAEKPGKEIPFRTADTDLAIYDGNAGTITMPHAIRMEGKKGETLTSNRAVYQIDQPLSLRDEPGR